MFDLSSAELLLIAVVALIVIGPKDLPKMVKTLALYMRKARSLAREFQSGIEEIAREAELEDIKKGLENAAPTNLAHEFERSIDPGGSVTRSLELQAENAASGTGVVNATPPTGATAAEPATQAPPAAIVDEANGAGNAVAQPGPAPDRLPVAAPDAKV